ncbi:unnamed protein product [Oppiella nova]|uniref:F-box domain-containing protein n=1 Tax=Oppiella nova TaxID=334625 RepID=A0A7R9M0K2_9ACAR|nr:unnamed protein product [Oppiella nova]CAG2168725.1 unnamed protein product [Oppiella nova]
MDSRSCGQLSADMAKMPMNGTQEEYPKDSFDRFGDDLCEVILSYLSFEDCFRFECLSKQWQRSVFTSRHIFSVSDIMPKKSQFNEITDNGWKALESVVKKWTHITDIHIDIDSQDMERVFEILMNSYKHLKTIDVRFKPRIDVQIIDRIVCKYGSLLTAISLPPSGCEDVLELSLTKLRQLSGEYCDEMWSTIVTENNELLFKNLTQFRVLYSLSDWHRLTPFVDHYKNSLKSLSIRIDRLETSAAYILLFKQLSRMKALRELNIQMIPIINPKTLETVVDYHCKDLVNRWSHLKRYQLVLCCKTDPHFSRLYESVCRMKRLQRLDFFDSVDTHLPHIESLKITSRLEITPTIVAIVEKLPHLKCFDWVNNTRKYDDSDDSTSSDEYTSDVSVIV